MKSGSLTRLLEIGQFLFQKQDQIKKYLDVKTEFYRDEIKMILHALLLEMGIISMKGHSITVLHTDHYEYMKFLFDSYCEGKISTDAFTDHFYALQVQEVNYVVNGEVARTTLPSSFIQTLFELKLCLQNKRNKWMQHYHEECEFLRVEKKILNIVLMELGKKRYF